MLVCSFVHIGQCTLQFTLFLFKQASSLLLLLLPFCIIVAVKEHDSTRKRVREKSLFQKSLARRDNQLESWCDHNKMHCTMGYRAVWLTQFDRAIWGKPHLECCDCHLLLLLLLLIWLDNRMQMRENEEEREMYPADTENDQDNSSTIIFAHRNAYLCVEHHHLRPEFHLMWPLHRKSFFDFRRITIGSSSKQNAIGKKRCSHDLNMVIEHYWRLFEQTNFDRSIFYGELQSVSFYFVVFVVWRIVQHMPVDATPGVFYLSLFSVATRS